jgi:anti-anti-sigma factor
MTTDWSDNIVIAELNDEPTLSEELSSITQQVERTAGKVPHVVLNFAGVSYVNSSNLAQLIKLRNLMKGRDATLKLCSVQDEVRSIFGLTGLDKIFRFAPDPMTALAGLQLEESEQ